MGAGVKTAKVRILVAISDDGGYAALGDSSLSSSKLKGALAEQVNSEGWIPPVIFHWVEVRLPVPPGANKKAIKGRLA